MIHSLFTVEVNESVHDLGYMSRVFVDVLSASRLHHQVPHVSRT